MHECLRKHLSTYLKNKTRVYEYTATRVSQYLKINTLVY